MEPLVTAAAPALHRLQLEKMLQYKNENVLSRFLDIFSVSGSEAEDIFQETKKFLFLCQLPRIYITDDLVIIDEMWHNFILFTKEYHNFCQQHFGKYFHHLPASKKEKEEASRKVTEEPEKAKEEYKAMMRHIMGAAYDNLGEETVIKWFQVYPEKYNKEALLKIRKK